jgi:branched-chain amino acid transport system permease protein
LGVGNKEGKVLFWRGNLPSLVVLFVLYPAFFLLHERGVVDDFLWINAAIIGVYVILAVSLNLITGVTGQFSLGHAAFMMIGAYVAAVFSKRIDLGLVELFGFWGGQLNLLFNLIAGGLVAAAFGLLVGIPTLRLRGDYLAMATLAFGQIMVGAVNNVDYIGGPRGIPAVPQWADLTWIVVVAVLVVIFVRHLVDSAFGRNSLAIREDEDAAESLGLHAHRVKVVAFAVGTFIAGVAGALYANYFHVVHPSAFSIIKSIEILVMVVLGGLGSVTGAIVGVIAVVALSSALAAYPAIRMIVFSLILLLAMLYRPSGLVGSGGWGISALRERWERRRFVGKRAAAGAVGQQELRRH